MKSKKKWGLIIGFGVVALIAIALVVVLVVLNQDPPEPEKNKYTISITVNNLEYGMVSGLNEDCVYTEGDSIELTITPFENMCIESVYVGGVNVCDYITDETINIQSAFTYTIESISQNLEVFVNFDEAMTIDGLEYKTRQESGVSNEVYGSLRIWGASNVFPKNGRVRLEIAPSGRYDLISYILPDDRKNVRDAGEDYVYVDENDSTRTMEYDSKSQSFIMSKAFVKLDPAKGFQLELVFVPTTIDFYVYYSDSGETFENVFTSKEKLYTNYILDSSRLNGYTWYYCIKSPINITNSIKADIKEKTISGTTLKYIELDHNLYIDNLDSKKIILVCVKNN